MVRAFAKLSLIWIVTLLLSKSLSSFGSDGASSAIMGIYDTPGFAYDVVVIDNYAYVADGESGLQIIDVSDPTSPTRIGYCDTPGNAVKVFVTEGYAYIADEGGGLQIIDISDPVMPQLAGNYGFGWAGISDVYVSDNFAFIFSRSQLKILDVSNPASPIELGTPAISGDALYVTDNFAFMTHEEWWEEYLVVCIYDLVCTLIVVHHGWSVLDIIDVNNPTAPTIQGHCSLPSQWYCAFYNWWGDCEIYGSHAFYTTCISGNSNFVYLGLSLYGDHRLVTISVSDPGNPSLISQFNLSQYPYDIHLEGRYMCIACGDRIIVMNSNPRNLYIIDTFAVPAGASAVTTNEGYIYVANGQAGLTILDTCIPPRADLIVSSLSYSPGLVNSGDIITIDFTVENQGQQNAGGSWTEIWVSRTGVVDRSDRLGEDCFWLGSQWIAPLAAGESRDYTMQVIFPFKRYSESNYGGNYFMCGLVDVLNEVDEGACCEANNTTCQSLQVGCDGIDLGLKEVRFSPEVINYGETLILVANGIFNFGSGDSPVSDCIFFISPDPVFSYDDWSFGPYDVQPITSYCGTMIIEDIAFTLGIPSGEYFVGAIVDYSDVIGECNELNNVRLAPQKLVVEGPPDLMIKSVKVDRKQLLAGIPFNFEAVVGNYGDWTAAPCYFDVFLSADERIDGSEDFLVGRFIVEELGIGEERIVTQSFTIDPVIPAGAYYSGAIVDSTDFQHELNNDNNAGFPFGKITVGDVADPDLIVKDVDMNTSSVEPAGNLQLTATVKNQGLGTSGHDWIEFYLSPDRVICREELLRDISGNIVSENAPELGHYQEYAINKDISLPADVLPGTYYVGAVCDVIDEVIEANEYNNQEVASQHLTIGNVTQDLMIDIMNVGRLHYMPEDSMSYILKVENSGSQPVEPCWVECFLSQDRFIDRAVDIYLGSFNTSPGLGAGESQTYIMRSNIPMIPPGEYYLAALIDVIDEVPEDNEVNNYCIYFWKITIE